MKRNARPASAKHQHLCQYQGCEASLPTVAALRAHHRTHSGDKPWLCGRPSCNARFTVRGELRAHTRTAHLGQFTTQPNTSPGERIPSLSGLENDEHAELCAEKTARTDETNLEGATTEALKEVAEIVDNCAYFATQLRAARSSAIVGWTGGDFRNAHRWAVCVGEQLKDTEENDAMVSASLRAKGVSMHAMRNAERLLFDSVLGCDALDEKMIEPLCASISTLGDGEDTSVWVQSQNALTDALTASLRRKEALCLLHDSWKEVAPSAASSTEAYELIADGAARVLLASHERQGRQNDVRNHMRLLADAQGGPELLIREALCSGGGMVAEGAIAAVNAACDRVADRGLNFFESIPIEIMVEGCKLSFALYDRFLGHLLQALSVRSDAGVKSHDEDIMNREMDVNEKCMQHLAACDGQVGILTRALIDRLIDRGQSTGLKSRLYQIKNNSFK